MITRKEALAMIGLASGSMLVGALASTHGLIAAEKNQINSSAFTWKYKKLDPIACAERAYPGYYKAGCCYGSFEGIIGELRKEVGYPYNMIPTEMFAFGEGGVAGTASLCGALNGASAAIFLLAGGIDKERKEKAFDIIRELFNWYQQKALPDYRPNSPKYEIKASVSKSPLCHVSISRWCKATEFKAFSQERSDRCGWLTASATKYAVELLNKHSDLAFKAAHPLSAEIKTCRGCHDKGGMIENTRGMMDCSGCHFTGEMQHIKI